MKNPPLVIGAVLLGGVLLGGSTVALLSPGTPVSCTAAISDARKLQMNSASTVDVLSALIGPESLTTLQSTTVRLDNIKISVDTNLEAFNTNANNCTN